MSKEEIFALLDDVFAGRRPLSAFQELPQAQGACNINYFHFWVQGKIEKFASTARLPHKVVCPSCGNDRPRTIKWNPENREEDRTFHCFECHAEFGATGFLAGYRDLSRLKGYEELGPPGPIPCTS